MVLAALVPETYKNSTCSLYGPEPTTTFATTDPQIPLESASLNVLKLWKLDAVAGAPLFMV